jgi:hypothetical protein
MPGLGYRWADDARDHPFRGVVAPSPDAVTPRPRVLPWKAQASLDQGNTGTCVGHGARHWMQTAPIVDKPTVGPDAFALYRAAVLVDEWSENDGEAEAPISELQFGTSVRAVMKVFQRLGYLREYVRCYSATTVQVAVRTTTPVLLGTNWSGSMFRPSPEGVVRYDENDVRGGHCYLVHWFDSVRGLFLCQNSWGHTWGVDHPKQRSLKGQRGYFHIPGEDVEVLLREDGEAWTAVELRRPKVRG